jgi:hypothetical protein
MNRKRPKNQLLAKFGLLESYQILIMGLVKLVLIFFNLELYKDPYIP